jgi:hypothetical protein
VTKAASFTQAEVERVVRALKAVGESIRGVDRLPEGGFRVLTGAPAPAEPASDLERWRKSRGGRAA